MFPHWHRPITVTHKPSAEKEGKIRRGTWLALIAMGLSVIILAQDFSSVNVALTSMERQLDTDLTTVQWVINAYALVFGMLIVGGGRFADMFGRKRIFMIGSTIFACISLLGGLAPNVYLVIAARTIMGIGGALMWPAILGMTYAALPPKKAAALPRFSNDGRHLGCRTLSH
jgi:MFS family permease